MNVLLLFVLFHFSRIGIGHELTWNHLLATPAARHFFLQQLDEHRGRHARLGRNSFHQLRVAMTVALDKCSACDDIKSAMRILNMANTFHTKR